MKMSFILLVAALFIAPSFFAKPVPSLREKRLQAKTKFQIDKTVANTNAFVEAVSNEIKPEKTLITRSPLEKTLRADRIDKSSVLTPTRLAKKRKNTHIREWP